jgi:CheY-like chemotaxis protein/RNA polymerase subunit RPABC4/transcription elongation factor Spt4
VVQVDENEVPCPGCKAFIEADYATCPYCRRSLKTNCAGCGQPLRVDWKVCPHCNTSTPAQAPAEAVHAKESAAPGTRVVAGATPGAAPSKVGVQSVQHPPVPAVADGPLGVDPPAEAFTRQYIGVDLDGTALKPVPEAPAPRPPAPVQAAAAPVAPVAAPRVVAPPAAPAPVAPAAAEPQPSPANDALAGRRALRILVVDDDPDIRLIVSATLRGLSVPVEVVQARDGIEAIEKALESAPDMVILDVMMPNMDGFETCRALRSRVQTAFVPILMLTASADQDSRTKGYLIGTDDYMSKPFQPVELKLRVGRLLRRTYGI